MTTALLLVTVFWLAYSNGANDNFKGVATLYGSGTTDFRRALLWAMVATVAGSLVSIYAAEKLLSAFSGMGIVPKALIGTPRVLLAVGAGGALTIFLATRLGMPTSTTHALTGGLLGVAVAAPEGAVPWITAFHKFAGPLLLSPLVAVAFTYCLYPLLNRVRKGIGVKKRTCLCVGGRPPLAVQTQGDGTLVFASSGLSLTVDQIQSCVERYQGRIAGIDAQTSMEFMHYLSAGAVCFSRAVNDTPKIAALLFASQVGGGPWVLGMVALAMALGGLVNSRKVAETMSKRLVDFSPEQGLCANLSTAFLVLAASRFGLPVSTTHVSCGSIFGIGLLNRSCRARTAKEVLAAWAMTLPFAGLLSGGLFWLIR